MHIDWMIVSYFLTILAIPVGIVVRKRAEAKHSQYNLSKQLKRSAVLMELIELGEKLPEREFMQTTLDYLEELTKSQIGFMHFVNDDGNSIELVAWSHSTLAKYCHAAYDNHYPVEQAGIWADAARYFKPVVINDYHSAPNKKGLPEGHSHLIRLMSVPVLDNGKVRMMTGVGNKPYLYTDYDVETVQLVGEFAWRIVRRKRIEKELENAMEVVSSSPTIICRLGVSDDFPILYVSNNFEKLGYSIDELYSKNLDYKDIIHKADRESLIEELSFARTKSHYTFTKDYRLITKDRSVIWMHISTVLNLDENGEPGSLGVLLTDITEKKIDQIQLKENYLEQKRLIEELQLANRQLIQSDKMASLGQLAAGIVHELNTPFSYVSSNIGSLEKYIEDYNNLIIFYQSLLGKMRGLDQADTKSLEFIENMDIEFISQDLKSLLEETKEGLYRIRKIIGDLKSFSHSGDSDWLPADINQALESTLNIARNEIKYKCEVEKSYNEIPMVECLVTQLSQVFLNIIINAGHAIVDKGTIRIKTSLFDEKSVLIEICDTGKGIPPENLGKIFEPFFTTKPIGLGTGLGLSISFGIIEKHNGKITVESEVGKGTCFSIVIPIHH
ncbi:MAG: GAF domain-containing protein [Leptospiraceae bacterium]|nr:GAF domain-containing protein [Leptospiraceae bacterium]